MGCFTGNSQIKACMILHLRPYIMIYLRNIRGVCRVPTCIGDDFSPKPVYIYRTKKLISPSLISHAFCTILLCRSEHSEVTSSAVIRLATSVPSAGAYTPFEQDPALAGITLHLLLARGHRNRLLFSRWGPGTSAGGGQYGVWFSKSEFPPRCEALELGIGRFESTTPSVGKPLQNGDRTREGRRA